MLRSLGITTMLKWFLVACVLLAIWQAYNGNIGAIAQAVWSWIQAGADVVTRIWNEVNSGGKGK
jgi:hypothetical protein